MSAKDSKARTWIVIEFRFQVDALIIIVDDVLGERERDFNLRQEMTSDGLTWSFHWY